MQYGDYQFTIIYLMNLKQQLLLSPLEKYEKYNRIPYKSILAISLVLLTTLQVLFIMNNNEYKNKYQFKEWTFLYFDQSIYEPEIFEESEFQITNITELQLHFQYIFQSLLNIPESSLQILDFTHCNFELVVHKEFYTGLVGPERYLIDINQGFVQPFDMNNLTSVNQFLVSSSAFQINITNISLKLGVQQSQSTWKNLISYEFSQRAAILISLEMVPDYNTVFEGNQIQTPNLYVYLNLLVFVFAIWSLWLNYRYFRRISYLLYDYSKSIYISNLNRNSLPGEIKSRAMFENLIDWVVDNQIPLRALTWYEIIQIVDLWIVVSTISNICQIIGTIYILIESQSSYLVGISCILAWLVLFKVLKSYNPKYNMLNDILSMCLPILLRFAISFMPVFMAYLVFGSCVFWNVDIFSSVNRTIATLMCLMLGDSVKLIAQSIRQFNGTFLSMYYVFGFMIVFTWGIHNIIISLIKEQFERKSLQLKKREMQEEGLLDNFTPVYQVEMQAEKEKQKLPFKFSKTYKQTIIRKALKGEQDRLILTAQRIFTIADQELKQLIRDFKEQFKYSNLSEKDEKEVLEQLREKLYNLENKLLRIIIKHISMHGE